ncbi:hypothetical protein NMT49_003534 [Vibrio cholerae]|nr:hypothetical protein [Vibrio cholerae]
MKDKFARKLARLDDRAYIRRCMWSDLDARIETEFKAFQKESLAAFGNLYLSQLKQKNQYKNSTLISSQFHNATYIKFGSRNLGIAKMPHKNNEPLAISSEENAQLYYTQGSIGDVLVVLSPYTSDVYNVHEKDIVIGRYKQPTDISAKLINKHLKVFKKYALASSHASAGLLLPYLFRRWLLLKDFRYKNNNRARLIFIIERVVLVLFAAVSAWLAK